MKRSDFRSGLEYEVAKQLEDEGIAYELDIRFVFSNSRNKLNKKSKTTYADWCDKHGFKWADKQIPKSWIDE